MIFSASYIKSAEAGEHTSNVVDRKCFKSVLKKKEKDEKEKSQIENIN